MEVLLFDGIHGDVEVFFRSYEIMTALQGYEGEAKKIVVGAFCTGAARYFYDKIVDMVKDYDEMKKEFIREFGLVSDPLAEFFARKQYFNENSLEYLYALEILAARAGNAITEQLFIQQFLRTTDVVTRSKLMSQIYVDKTHLKKVVRQLYNLECFEECAPNMCDSSSGDKSNQCVYFVPELENVPTPNQCASRTPNEKPHDFYDKNEYNYFKAQAPMMPITTSSWRTTETSPQSNNNIIVSREEDCMQLTLVQDNHNTSKRTVKPYDFAQISCNFRSCVEYLKK